MFILVSQDIIFCVVAVAAGMLLALVLFIVGSVAAQRFLQRRERADPEAGKIELSF
jgi:hypothetical protein